MKRHPKSWSLAVAFARSLWRPDDEMDDASGESGSSPIRRWPAIESRLLAVKTPSWLRSLTLHHQRYQLTRRSNSSLSSDGKLPRLGAMNAGDDSPADASGETSETENNNNNNNNNGDSTPRWTRRSTAAQRFAKLSRIVLPPLGAHEPPPPPPPHPDAGSWLLPIIPSAQRREAYRSIREQHKQFSAQTGRLPPIPHAGSSPPPPPPSGPSLSAPLPSNKGLMELCGSRPAKAASEDKSQQRQSTGTPLAALHRAKTRRGGGEVTQEESEKLARITVAEDAAATREKSDAHLRPAGSGGHRGGGGGGGGEGAPASRQVASDPGAGGCLPSLAASGSGGSDGPPVGRGAPSQLHYRAAPVPHRGPPSHRSSRDPASSERATGAATSTARRTTAARSNKQGRRRPPAVRWTIEWTDDQVAGAEHDDHTDDAQPSLAPIETTATATTAALADTTDADGAVEAPVVVMASPSASRRSTERQFRSAGRVRRSPPPVSSSSDGPDDAFQQQQQQQQQETPRSRSPPVPAVLARQRAQTAHPSLSPKSSVSNEPASIVLHSSTDEERAPEEQEQEQEQEQEEYEDDDDDEDEIIDNIQLHDLELNDSSPERSPSRRAHAAAAAESIKQPRGEGTAAVGDDDDDDDDEESENRNRLSSNNLQPNGADQLSRTSSVEHIKKLLNNNQLDDAEDLKLVPASSPTFRRPTSEHVVYREENCLPNAVQNPDDRPAFVSSGSSRYVDYTADFDDEDEVFGHRAGHHDQHHQHRDHRSSHERVTLTEEEYEDDDSVNFESALRPTTHYYATANSTTSSPSKSAARLGTKSRSLASFAGRSSSDDSARRQRSLPVRRFDSTSLPSGEKTSNGVKKTTGLMASCRRPTVAGASAAVRTHSPPVTNFKAPPDTLDPKIGLQMALKGINSSEWEDKLEGMRRLNELLAGYSDSLTHETHTIALALLVEVKNLRSQVSRAAIQSIGKMFQHCGKHMEQDLDRSVSLLLNKAGDTNRFIRDDAHSALVNVTEYVSAPKAIVAITAEGLTHKNSTVRAEAAKLLAAIVVRLGPAKTLCGAKDITEKVLPAAAHFVQDGSLEARGQAKIMFSVMIKDPVFDKALVKYLPPAVIRNIQRTLDVLKKNPQQF